jgi:hypothetical protein
VPEAASVRKSVVVAPVPEAASVLKLVVAETAVAARAVLEAAAEPATAGIKAVAQRRRVVREELAVLAVKTRPSMGRPL